MMRASSGSADQSVAPSGTVVGGALRSVALTLVGMALGLAFITAVGIVGPLKAFIGAVGLGVAVAILIRPDMGFVLMISAIPLERVGRLTNMDSVVALSIAKVIGILTLLGWGIRLCLRREHPIVTREFIPLSLFGLIGLLSLTYSTDVAITEITISRYVTTLAFFFLVINLVRSPHLIRTTLIGFLTVTTLVGILALAMRVTPSFVITDADYDAVGVLTDGAEEDRVGNVASTQGLTTHPGFYVCSLLIALPLYLYFYQTTQSLAWRVVLALSGYLALLNLFLTHRRAGVLTLGLLVLILLKKRLVVISPAIPLTVAALALSSLLILPASFWERVFSFAAYDPSASNNVGARLDMWEGALMLIRDHWLLGVGMGNHSELRNYNDLSRILTESGAHNGYLQMLVELGVVGTMVFLPILWMLWKNLSRAEQPPRGKRMLPSDLVRLTGFLKLAFLAPVVLALGGIEFTQPLRDWWLVCGLGIVLRRWAERPTPTDARTSQGADGG